MAKKKLSAKNIATLGATTAVLGASISLSASYIISGYSWGETFWETFKITMAWINGLANLPLLLSSSDALRQELGLRSPIQIIGNSSKRAFGRRIPINSGDKQTNIFMQTLSLAPGTTGKPDHMPVEIETISVWYDENEYTLTIPEIEKFLYAAWRRQGQSKNGLSRQYWTRQCRPRLKTLDYNIRIWALTACQGIIIGRSEGRSGRLSVSPRDAMSIIKERYL